MSSEGSPQTPTSLDNASRTETIYGIDSNLAGWTPLPVIARPVHAKLSLEMLIQLLNRSPMSPKIIS